MELNAAAPAFEGAAAEILVPVPRVPGNEISPGPGQTGAFKRGEIVGGLIRFLVPTTGRKSAGIYARKRKRLRKCPI